MQSIDGLSADSSLALPATDKRIPRKKIDFLQERRLPDSKQNLDIPSSIDQAHHTENPENPSLQRQYQVDLVLSDPSLTEKEKLEAVRVQADKIENKAK